MATKGDVFAVKNEVKADVFAVKADVLKLDGKLTLLHWMIGITLAGVGAIFAKLFLG